MSYRGIAWRPSFRERVNFEATTVMAMGRLNNVWDQLFPVERHRIANLMIERIDLVHTGAENPPRLETNPERLVAFRPKG